MADTVLVQISEAVVDGSVLVTDLGDHLAVNLTEETLAYATVVVEATDNFDVDIQEPNETFNIDVAVSVDDIVVSITEGGAATATEVKAGEAISGHSAYVIGAGGKAFAASSDNPLHQFVAGITLSSAPLDGVIHAQADGSITHLGWGFTPGELVLLGLNGALTHVLPPTAIFTKVLGVALTPDTISLNFQSAIFQQE